MTNCVRCGRALKNPEAVRKGIGPVCERKQALADARQSNEVPSLIGPRWQECGKIILRRAENGTAQANIEHKYLHHSPSGFEWGYGGSGPADLARNILLQVVGNDEGYQRFKFAMITTVPREGGEISVEEVKRWARDNQPRI